MDARHPEGRGILFFNMVWNQAIKFICWASLLFFSKR